MRKTLRSIDECMHFFANKVQPYGECGIVSFDDEYLYSYSFRLARWLPDGSLAIATQSRSLIIARHRQDFRQAIPREVRLIQVPFLDYPERVVEAAKEMSDNLVERSLTARALAGTFLEQARSILAEANAYAEALGCSERAEYVGLTSEQAKARVAALKASRKAKREEKAAQAAKALLTGKEQLAKWLSDSSVRSSPSLRELSVRLRIKGDQIETTQGAFIPVADAIKLWPLIQRCKAGDKCFTPGQPLGHYRLTKIRDDGSIVVGCHDVPYTELQRIATQLNLV